MRKLLLTASISVFGVLSLAACSTSEPIDINTMGLEKTSPFETPASKPFELNAGQYRATQLGAPAMVPHSVENYKISPNANPCMMCHGNKSRIDAPKTKGMPTSMPSTHWTKVDGNVIMHPSRHECTLCHAPQADVQPLVPTTM